MVERKASVEDVAVCVVVAAAVAAAEVGWLDTVASFGDEEEDDDDITGKNQHK